MIPTKRSAMQFAVSNLQIIIIIVLIIALLLSKIQTGCNPFRPPIEHRQTIKTVIDTQYLLRPIVQIPFYTPVVDSVIHDTVRIPAPATNINDLTKQYKDLADLHYSTNVYSDSLALIDSAYPGKDLGKIFIKDRISENKITLRDLKYQLKFPTITNTTTVTNDNIVHDGGQVYVGVGITGQSVKIINGAYLGIMYKTKKDHIYQLQGGIIQPFNSTSVTPYIGISTFIKLRLRK